MTKRKTPGERIAFEIDPEGTATAALWRKKIAAKIDRAIADAWDEGHTEHQVAHEGGYPSRPNPYRKGGKR